jgi:hypothetical protein
MQKRLRTDRPPRDLVTPVYQIAEGSLDGALARNAKRHLISYAEFPLRRNPRETQFDDLNCRDLLRAGRIGYQDGFATLNLGLQAVAKTTATFFAAGSTNRNGADSHNSRKKCHRQKQIRDLTRPRLRPTIVRIARHSSSLPMRTVQFEDAATIFVAPIAGS